MWSRHEPYLVPRKTFDINENSHELRDSEGGMSIVKLDGDLVRERVEGRPYRLPRPELGRFVPANDVLSKQTPLQDILEILSLSFQYSNFIRNIIT